MFQNKVFKSYKWYIMLILQFLLLPIILRLSVLSSDSVKKLLRRYNFSTFEQHL